MKTLRNSVPFPSVPVKLSRERTLEAFEGPLLVLYRSAVGEPYLYYWCDQDAQFQRWIVIRTSTTDLVRYEAGNWSLREVVLRCRDEYVFVHDKPVHQGMSARVNLVPVGSLPGSYLPLEDSFRDPEDGCAPTNVQDVFLSDVSDGYELVQKYPRKYMQAYAFTSHFGENGAPFVGGRATYSLDSGWVFYQMYNDLKHGGGRSQLQEISFASPGYMRFSADETTAADLRRVLSSCLINASLIRSEVRQLRAYTSGRESWSDDQARAAVIRLASALQLSSQRILARFSLDESARILSSFMYRLSFLADHHRKGIATFVGVDAV